MKYVGIDWASDVHAVVLIASDGSRLAAWDVPHHANGVASLLAKLAATGGPEEVKVGIESGAPLMVDQLLEAGYSVYVLNPKQSERSRDRFSPAGAKDDLRDAAAIADAIRTDAGALRPLEPDSELTQELRLRDRARTHLVEQRVRVANRLRQVLARYHPALLRLQRGTEDAFLLALLAAYPDPATARTARPARVLRLLREHRIRVLDTEDVIAILREPSFVVSPGVVSACRDEALSLAKQIALLSQEIREAEAKLRSLFEEHPDRELMRSLPGLRDTLTIRVRAELGDRRAREGHAKRVQTYGGTAPVTRSTGQRGRRSRRPHVAMRRGCNRILQAALFHMARTSRARSGWADAYYRWRIGRGDSDADATRSLSNKWAKILAAVLRTRTPYDEARHVTLLRARGVEWLPQALDEHKEAA